MSGLTGDTTLSYIEEVVEGVIPTNPVFQELPTLSVEIEEKFSTKNLYYLNDRSPNEMILTQSIITGFAGFELSYEAWKPFLIEVLRNDSTAYEDFSFESDFITSAISPNRFEAGGTLDFAAEGLDIGQYIKVSGFAQSNNNGIFKIIALSGSEWIRVVGDNDLTVEDPEDRIIITVLSYADNKQPGKTYTFRKYSEVDGAPFYEYFTGCKIDKIYLNFRIGEIISGLLFIKGLKRTAVQVTGESVVEVASYALMAATTAIGHIYMGSVVSPERVFTELNIELDNLCKPGNQLADLSPEIILDDLFAVSISGQIYFEDLDVYKKWSAETNMDFGLKMSDGSNEIAIAMNKCRLVSITKPVPGKNAYLLERFTITSLLDTNDHCVYFNFH
jgi:hypothetical protein